MAEPGARRIELKAFLRARRAAVAPEAAGFARGTRRLTPGLRREELAAVARVGLTWYTWLEQGRDITVSREMLARVSRALRLTPTDEAYLCTLAGVPLAHDATDVTELPESLRCVVDGFTAGPAMVVGPAFDLLAYNALAALVYDFQPGSGRFGMNHLWRLFMDPSRRELYVDYEFGARNLVGIFRLRYAEHIGDPAFEELIAELERGSAFFRSIWAERETRPLATTILVRLNHPTFGRLDLHTVRATPADAPATTLYLLPAADEASTRAMRRARRA